MDWQVLQEETVRINIRPPNIRSCKGFHSRHPRMRMCHVIPARPSLEVKREQQDDCSIESHNLIKCYVLIGLRSEVFSVELQVENELK